MLCANCDNTGVFTTMTAIGEKAFCCEACYAEYVGLPIKEEGYYGLASETFEASIVNRGKTPKGAIEKAMMNHAMIERAKLESVIQELENKVQLGIISEEDLMKSLTQKFGADFEVIDWNNLHDTNRELFVQKTQEYYNDFKENNPKLHEDFEENVMNEESWYGYERGKSYAETKEKWTKKLSDLGYEYERIDDYWEYIGYENTSHYVPCNNCEGEGIIITKYYPATREDPAYADYVDCEMCEGKGKVLEEMNAETFEASRKGKSILEVFSDNNAVLTHFQDGIEEFEHTFGHREAESFMMEFSPDMKSCELVHLWDMVNDKEFLRKDKFLLCGIVNFKRKDIWSWVQKGFYENPMWEEMQKLNSEEDSLLFKTMLKTYEKKLKEIGFKNPRMTNYEEHGSFEMGYDSYTPVYCTSHDWGEAYVKDLSGDGVTFQQECSFCGVTRRGYSDVNLDWDMKAETKKEKLSKTSCCCGATESNPCACMKAPKPMNCSATEPKCQCYKDLEKNAENEDSCFRCGCKNDLVYCELCEDFWCNDECREPSCWDKHYDYTCTRNAAETFNAEEGDDCPNCYCEHQNLSLDGTPSVDEEYVSVNVVCDDCGMKGYTTTYPYEWDNEAKLEDVGLPLAVSMYNPNYGELRCSRCRERFEKSAENYVLDVE